MKRVAVIGAGASGLMSAIKASQAGAKVTLIEHKDRVGKKILMTGNGKCNLTNMSDYHGKYYSDNIDIAYHILEKFTPEDTRNFFKSIGLYTKEKKDGGVYPVSEQAASVLDALRTECEHLNVTTLLGSDIKPDDILIKENGILINVSGKKLCFDSVIIATGGKAASVAGSDGSGYAIAKALGHKVITPLPALVQLRCEGKFFKSIAGVRAQARLELRIDEKSAYTEEGELQLTDYGISGIPVFQFSRLVSKALNQNKKCEVYIDFLTYMSEYDKIDCINTYKDFEYKTVEEWLSGFTHKKIASLICKELKIEANLFVDKLTPKMAKACIDKLSSFKVTVKETNPFENAQVCCGGIPLTEIDDNMQSRKHKNVYFVGELLDCDGICGGYNLQWAWATSAIAADHCSR